MYDISTKEQQAIDEQLQGRIEWAETRKLEAEQLALDATRLLSCTSDRLDVYRNQGFFKRCWYSISGKIEEAQTANQRDLITMQKCGWRYISLLNERDLLMAHSMITVKNNLLTLAVAEDENRNEVRRMADKVYERFVALEDRMRQVEVATNIHGWLITLDTLDYDDRFTPNFRLLRIINDFISLKSGDWNPQELRYLQKAVKEADLPWKENISLESFVDGLIDEIEGSEYQIYEALLGNCNGHKVPVPFIFDNVAVPAYTSLFNIADNYAKSSDTIDALIENLDCSHTEAIKRVLFTFIKKNGVDLSAEVPLRDLAIELLSCMCMARNLYEASKESEVMASTASARNLPETSNFSTTEMKEVSSQAIILLPELTDCLASNIIAIMSSDVWELIQNYISDTDMVVKELASYFSLNYVKAILENGIQEATQALQDEFNEHQQPTGFEYKKNSLSKSFKLQAEKAINSYIESVAFIEIVGNELVGIKSSVLPDFTKNFIDRVKSGFSNGKWKSPEDKFDHAVQKSFELYDEMVEDIKRFTKEIFENYFKEFIFFLEKNGHYLELNQFLESMQQDIEEANNADHENDQEENNADHENDQQNNALRNNLLNVLKEFESSGYWVLDNIPKKKLQNVRRYPVDPTDEILAVIDTTLFGSAKCGMAFGLKGLYWRNDWETKTNRNFVAWGELYKSSKKIRGLKDNMSLLPGGVFNLSGSSVKAHDLTKLIQECIAAIATINYN